jgi:tubulin polyglutamylase TTLL6/13
VLPADFKTFRE